MRIVLDHRFFRYIGFPEAGARLRYLDSLKIIAAFAVVVTHIASIGWQALPVSDDQWFVTSVWEIASRFCVPIFFMCSGAVLLSDKRNIPPSRLLKHYILRTCLIALFVSAAFVSLQCFVYGWSGFRAFVYAVADGPYFIWYLWVLVSLYCLLPFLASLVRNDRLFTALIGLLFMFVIGNSTLNTMFPDSPATAWINNFLLFSSGAEGLFYFLIGGWFASHEIGKRPRLAMYCAGAVSLVLAIILNYEHSLQHGWDLYYVNRGNILIAIMSCALFLCFQYSRSADGKMGKLGKWVVSCGLMIYLIHPFVRLVLEGFPVFDPIIQLMYDHAAAGVLIVSGAVYLISLAISSVLKWAALAIRKYFLI